MKPETALRKVRHCPTCKAVRDLNLDNPRPKPGEVTVCLNCAEILMVTRSGNLRVPAREELQALKERSEWPMVQELVTCVQGLNRQMQGLLAMRRAGQKHLASFGSVH